MSYLSREESPIDNELWERIDDAVVGTARKVLIGRRFLHIYGPLGIGVESINIDDGDAVDEEYKDGMMTTKGRKFVEIPTLYSDFSLLAKDIANSGKLGVPADLSRATAAAEACAQMEDRLIFFGDKAHGYEGLLTASGVNKVKRNDWMAGESPFTDVAAALELLASKGVFGAYALAVSPDLYMQMQRIQQGTGLLEIDRVAKMIGGNVFKVPVMGSGKAVLVGSEARNMDLAVGQDMAAGYLEQVDLNHHFRVLETALLRIKRREAVVVIG